MPEDEDALAAEDVLVVHDLLSGHLAVVADLGPHVVDQEGLSEHVLVVRVWHGLEVKGHRGTGLNITNLVAASGRVHVSVEETSDWGAVLWEQWVVKTLIELLIVVNHVVRGWGEQTADLLVGEQGIKQVDLVQGWLGALISDSGKSEERGEGEMNFPDWSIAEHVEGESGVADAGACPSVIGSLESLADLVEVVTGSLSELPVVVLEEVVRVLELGWVTLGLGL